MNVTIESAHCDWEEIRARIMFGRRCVESIIEYDQRQNVISNCDTQYSHTFLGQSVHS